MSLLSDLADQAKTSQQVKKDAALQKQDISKRAEDTHVLAFHLRKIGNKPPPFSSQKAKVTHARPFVVFDSF